jgi:ferritin-like metal-binding protein YciE
MEHFRAFLRAMFSSRRLRHTERMKRFRKEKICGWRDFEGRLGVTPEPGRIRRSSAIRSSFDMKLKTLEDLFLHELKDLFSAENQLVKALPKMAKAATNEELKAGFEEHLEQTRGHVERLEEIAEMLGKKLGGHKCKAMEGLVEEGAELISEDAEDAIRDAGLIGAAQRVEHYEMAGYGTARTGDQREADRTRGNGDQRGSRALGGTITHCFRVPGFHAGQPLAGRDLELPPISPLGNR